MVQTDFLVEFDGLGTILCFFYNSWKKHEQGVQIDFLVEFDGLGTIFWILLRLVTKSTNHYVLLQHTAQNQAHRTHRKRTVSAP